VQLATNKAKHTKKITPRVTAVIGRTHLPHTHLTNCSTWTTNMVCKCV